MNNKPHIEIRDVQAHRVDADGRVHGVRVLGVADRRDRTILVRLHPLAGSDTPQVVSEMELGATAYARMVRPESVGWLPANAHFAADLGEPAGRSTQAPFWCAEFDLDLEPQVPRLELGLQARPWQVRAEDLYAEPGDPEPAVRTLDRLHMVPAFAVGVLLVHGIGQQTKSETLSGWSAPLLAWTNQWFAAACARLADRADPKDAEGWLASLAVRESWRSHDPDAGDRYRLAKRFAEQVLAREHDDGRVALVASAARSLSHSALRRVSPDEQSAAARFAAHLRNDLGGGVVGGMAELADARLLDGATRGADPSTVELRVHTLAPEGEVQRSHWLMAESHWAESFRPPAFFAFGWWCLRTAPVIWVHYFALNFERRGRSWLRGGPALLPLASVVLLAVLGFAALFVLSLIPWDRLRKGLVSLQRVLAGVVGDSYVFLNDPVQRRSIIDRVRRDVEWLSQRCRQVVVVAHSQGAAVADRALNNGREYDPERLHTLVTLGAGVQTLNRIGELKSNRYVIVAGVMALVAAAAFWAGVLLWACTGAAAPGAGVALLALLLLALAGQRALNAHPGLSSMPLRAAGNRPWIDFFATRDPVPWGPLARVDGQAGQYTPNEVANLHSFASDHTSYWHNPEQVVGPLVRVVARAAGLEAVDQAVPDAAALLGHAAQARRTRVQWLRAARAVAALCTLALLWAQWPSIVAVAGWAWQAALARLGVAAADGAAGWPGWRSVGRVLALLLPWLLYSTVLLGVWAGWGRVELERIVATQAPAVAAARRFAFALAVAALVALTVWLGYSPKTS